MILKHQTIELDGRKTFERIVFNNFGRFPKVLEDEACFLFLEQGSFQVRTPQGSFSLLPKEGFLTKCGEYYFEEIKDQKEPIEAIGVYFHLEVVKEIFSTLGKSWHHNPTGKLSPDDILKNYRESLLLYMKNPQLFDREMKLLKIKELLLVLSNSLNAPSIQHFISSLFSKSEIEIRQVVESNLYANVGVEQLAFLCGMSLAQFKRKFTQYYQEAPATYLRTRKLAKAADMLCLKDSRVGEVAYDCGFESISTFNRAFKSHFGLSPSQFFLSQNAQMLS